MPDKARTLVTEILRGLRPDLLAMREETRAEFGDLKVRLTAFEAATGQLFSLDAAKSQRLDRLEDRVKRIERDLLTPKRHAHERPG